MQNMPEILLASQQKLAQLPLGTFESIRVEEVGKIFLFFLIFSFKKRRSWGRESFKGNGSIMLGRKIKYDEFPG